MRVRSTGWLSKKGEKRDHSLPVCSGYWALAVYRDTLYAKLISAVVGEKKKRGIRSSLFAVFLSLCLTDCLVVFDKGEKIRSVSVAQQAL